MGTCVVGGLVQLLFLIILFTVTGCSAYCSNETLLTANAVTSRDLRSPNYPRNYPNNQECGWRIRTEGLWYKVRLYVADINLEDSDDCKFDNLSIYDGGLPSSDNLLAKLCGTDVSSRNFYSSGPEVFVKFRSDNSVTSKGFMLSYKAIRSSTTLPTTTTTTIPFPDHFSCGTARILTASAYDPKALLSPNYPSPYPINQECEWRIRTENQWYNNVHLLVADIHLEHSDGCVYDSLSIFDGGQPSNDSLLAKLCGTNGLRRSFYSSGQEILVKFKSDSSEAYRGFRLLYKAVHRLTTLPTTTTTPDYFPCGTARILTASDDISRALVSPNYPSNYPNNQECEWRIRTENQWYNNVHLLVADIHLEQSDGCVYDSLSIFDGGLPSNDSLLAKLCGTNGLRRSFYSSGQEILVKFKSDSSEAYRGFRLLYKAVHLLTTLPTATTTPDYFPCGTARILTASIYYSRALVSPNYPSNYPNNQECEWRIRTENQWNNNVRLHVADIRLEHSDGCVYDSLSIFDGGLPSNDSLLAKLCGTNGLGSYFYSSGQEILVKFKSDSSGTYRGFRLLYKAVHHFTTLPTTTSTPDYFPCGTAQILTASPYNPGTLVSPNYPSNYPNYQECGWRIITESRRYNYVRLHVADIHLEGSFDCKYDSLSIYDGGNPTADNLIVKLCGTQGFNSSIYSVGQEVFVQFKSDLSVTYRGFKLQFQAVEYTATTTRPWTTTTRGQSKTSSFRIFIWPLVGTAVGIPVVFLVAMFVCRRRYEAYRSSAATTRMMTPAATPVPQGPNSTSQHGVYILPASQPSRPSDVAGTGHTNAAYSPEAAGEPPLPSLPPLPSAPATLQLPDTTGGSPGVQTAAAAESRVPPSYSEVMREVAQPPSYEETMLGAVSTAPFMNRIE
ncbi:scavenger receptor cysteine-rich domain-containing protein DMBT1-like isoform X1 [Babylonia areolata]|uniref:scavenger receptor cysteine-rich domain-containing protein DMBT1-like isoform X1 n=1 Tax=Babylonia areolata TaxID=304850 RepID=UPI003FD3B529